jgi:hypothetical protein
MDQLSCQHLLTDCILIHSSAARRLGQLELKIVHCNYARMRLSHIHIAQAEGLKKKSTLEDSTNMVNSNLSA